MLMKWRAFLEICDPDIITGYNVQNFDIPYLLDRATTLSKGNKTSDLKNFAQWGRIKNVKAKMKDTTFQSAAFGKRNNVETTIDGRVIFDMLPYMQRNHKLSSYTLNSVCAEYLGQQKEDVHHSIISDLQNGSDEDRHRLAVYCLKDALLPQRLMDKLSVLVNYIEMARVTGVPMSFLISRGQQIKVYSMILRKCRKVGLLVPTLQKSGGPGDGDVGYEGATVLDPIKNYYEVPIATLDFASLYPSIMQAVSHDTCMPTFVLCEMRSYCFLFSFCSITCVIQHWSINQRRKRWTLHSTKNQTTATYSYTRTSRKVSFDQRNQLRSKLYRSLIRHYSCFRNSSGDFRRVA